MKRKGILALAIALPVLFAAGCAGCDGTSNLAIGANWYSDVGYTDIGDTRETLEYEVTFRAPQTAGSVKVEYETGSYQTTLTSKLDEETNQLAYELTSVLEISGTYTSGSERESFQDRVESRVVFLSAKQQLRPLRSYKKAKIAPIYGGVAQHYETSTVYDAELSKATVTTKDLKNESAKAETKEYPIQNNGTYFDNEEILFAIRGLDLTAARSFYTLNPSDKKLTGASVTATSQSEMKFDSLTIGGESRERKIPYFGAELRYTSTPSGQIQLVRYAKTVNSSANTYRNVLLYMEAPLSYGMGTLVYTLKNANFAK